MVSPPDPADPAAELSSRRRMVLVTAIGAVVAAVLLFALVMRAMSTGSSTAGGGEDGRAVAQFDVGDARARASSVARDGPFLFPDPRGGSRDIILQHLGGADWVAFEARAGGAPRQCALRWEPDPGQFVDPCAGRIYPRDGAGLVSFPARVNDKGRVVVDLSRPTPASSP